LHRSGFHEDEARFIAAQLTLSRAVLTGTHPLIGQMETDYTSARKISARYEKSLAHKHSHKSLIRCGCCYRSVPRALAALFYYLLYAGIGVGLFFAVVLTGGSAVLPLPSAAWMYDSIFLVSERGRLTVW
jgi:hypothetical protein